MNELRLFRMLRIQKKKPKRTFGALSLKMSQDEFSHVLFMQINRINSVPVSAPHFLTTQDASETLHCVSDQIG